MNERIVENMLKRESGFSQFATLSSNSIRLKSEKQDIRTPFFRDVDRIIHSWSYSRYSGKTQVFSFPDDDHVSRRMIHVQLVSKIARTIGRALSLNEDLIEAGALGHDIGHTPLGHSGEAILNRISLRELGEIFSHNVQSVRTYMCIEHGGDGLNLSVQVLDAILCHNGEICSSTYFPMKKTVEEFLKQYESCYTDNKVLKELCPMTLEGCVVRISDLIGYIGRDIEDAIRLGKISRQDIPENIKNVLGITNQQIVNTIILDVIENSFDKPYIKMSDEVFKAMIDLKKFNYEHIYRFSNSKESLEYFEEGMNHLFKKYLCDIENENIESDIYKFFLIGKSSKYLSTTSDKRKVLDYLAGMTDNFLKKMIEQNLEELS